MQVLPFSVSPSKRWRWTALLVFVFLVVFASHVATARLPDLAKSSSCSQLAIIIIIMIVIIIIPFSRTSSINHASNLGDASQRRVGGIGFAARSGGSSFSFFFFFCFWCLMRFETFSASIDAIENLWQHRNCVISKQLANGNQMRRVWCEKRLRMDRWRQRENDEKEQERRSRQR